MNPAVIEMMKSIRIPLELNAQPGDNILIVADTRTNPDMWGAMAAAANELGMEPTVTIMNARAAHGYDPTSPIVQAALDANVKLIVYMTTTALAHTKLTTQLNRTGRKFILMEEVVPEMFLQGGPCYADVNRMMELGDKITGIWRAGKTVQVLSEGGTNLTASIDGRPALTEAGKIRITPENAGKTPSGCAFPCGESNTCPLEGTGEGTIVFDLTAHSVGTLKEPIRLTVKKGMVTSIEGGLQAAKWRDILEKHGDPGSYNCPAEISIGLNPNVTPTGSMRTDKKLYASCHIGIGDTVALGGTCHAKLRLEGVIRHPTIIVDGRTIATGGRILIDERTASAGK